MGGHIPSHEEIKALRERAREKILAGTLPTDPDTPSGQIDPNLPRAKGKQRPKPQGFCAVRGGVLADGIWHRLEIETPVIGGPPGGPGTRKPELHTAYFAAWQIEAEAIQEEERESGKVGALPRNTMRIGSS